ncbi:hypothetical protein PPL_03803 [Heterostelium album PN500]|uniref:Uncharacterized protein n=1 Tax=Heterostelium pallidum (strain ATCC 26659 / Pp 5 / PN500) TaxID=670386 RepID=D3B6Q0_HETP5|nr:hypothetical protein PPL_03803 [Heterostelium album PN500]EFA83020.1 hypothetical protein PPL_03803 [Heterostelium album PN500]|eukprot:XP_020435137.1 hypothetical protein PPL_03803 [Heterostelium album PN500]
MSNSSTEIDRIIDTLDFNYCIKVRLILIIYFYRCDRTLLIVKMGD